MVLKGYQFDKKISTKFYFFYYLFIDILEESFGVSKQNLLSTDWINNVYELMGPFGNLILLERTRFNGTKEVFLSTVEVNLNQTGILKLCVSSLILLYSTSTIC